MIYYTDGSCIGNGKAVNKGGFGIVALDDDGNFVDCYAKRNENTTNNREEEEGQNGDSRKAEKTEIGEGLQRI